MDITKRMDEIENRVTELEDKPPSRETLIELIGLEEEMLQIKAELDKRSIEHLRRAQALLAEW